MGGAEPSQPRRGGPRSRAIPLLSASLVVVIGCAVGLVLAELGLRVSGIVPPPGIFTVSQAEFERIPGIFAPNQSVLERPGSRFEHLVTIDSLGYRGRGFTRSKPPGQFRLLIAGDSFTWGHNVADDETLPAHLERLLQQVCGDIVVVNAGISGSSILAQEAMVRRGLVIDPDLVVLVYHENDIDELTHSRMWERLAENRAAKSRFPMSIAYPALRSTTLWNLALMVRRRLAASGSTGASDPSRPPSGGDPEAVERSRAEYAARLADLSSDLAERGITLVFVTYPHPESVGSGSGGRDYAWALETASALELPSLDLLGPIRTSGLTLEQAYLVPEDYHPSSAGHEVAAAALARFVQRSSGVSSCPDRDESRPPLRSQARDESERSRSSTSP